MKGECSMKKVLALALVITFVLGIAGCGDVQQAAQTAANTTDPVVSKPQDAAFTQPSQETGEETEIKAQIPADMRVFIENSSIK